MKPILKLAGLVVLLNIVRYTAELSAWASASGRTGSA